jgi:hypothetical protein
MRKFIGPLLTIILIVGVGTAVYFSVSEQLTQSSIVSIKGLIGSEKYEFFHDPRVVEALKRDGLEVQVQKAGSRQIATSFNLKEYDFAFPAGVPAAEKIRREHKVNKRYSVFFTPMAIASWKIIADTLIANGVVEKRENAYYIIDLPKLLELIVKDKRWNELLDNKDYNVNKSILVVSTDIRKSNSAAMYLALASYILNGRNIVSSEAQISPIIDSLSALFLRQGFVEDSSAVPFKDYLVMGPGKAPLVMIYEAQYLYEAANPQGGVSDDMVLLYPEPTIFTKHILVPLSEGGEKLGEALTTDPELQKLAIEHGLRNENIASFKQFVKQHHLAVPERLVNVIEPPSYEILEHMITLIEQRYAGEH